MIPVTSVAAQRPRSTLTGDELRSARLQLGAMWARRLSCADLAKALRLAGDDAGKAVSDMERGRRAISGPVSVCVEAWLAGAPPPCALG